MKTKNTTARKKDFLGSTWNQLESDSEYKNKVGAILFKIKELTYLLHGQFYHDGPKEELWLLVMETL